MNANDAQKLANEVRTLGKTTHKELRRIRRKIRRQSLKGHTQITDVFRRTRYHITEEEVESIMNTLRGDGYNIEQIWNNHFNLDW